MNVLVAYASRHGATQGIAERIVGRLRAAGCEAHARLVNAAGGLDQYEAFVIGSACYLGRWRPEATEFVHRHQVLLAERPSWLFSSGPLGPDPTQQGQDGRAAGEPQEIAEFRETIHPRDHRVFFGALDPRHLGLGDPAIRSVPVGHAVLPEVDFRDWPQIEAWANSIAGALAQVPTVAAPG